MLPFLGSRDLDIIDKVVEEVSVPTNRSLKLLIISHMKNQVLTQLYRNVWSHDKFNLLRLKSTGNVYQSCLRYYLEVLILFN